MYKTIRDLCQGTTLAHASINKAILRGNIPQTCVHKSGDIWLIDDEDPEFQEWFGEAKERSKTYHYPDVLEIESKDRDKHLAAVRQKLDARANLSDDRCKPLLSLAQEFGISPNTLRHAARSGKFAAFKRGGDWFVDMSHPQISQWIQKHLHYQQIAKKNKENKENPQEKRAWESHALFRNEDGTIKPV